MITIENTHKDTIKEVYGVAQSKSVIPICENVLIHAKDNMITLTATDLTIEYSRTIPAKVESEIKTTVNAEKFYRSFATCKKDVSIELNDELIIKSGRSKFKLPMLSADDFPSFNSGESIQKLNIKEDLKEIISNIFWAVPKDDARHYLNGVYVGHENDIAARYCEKCKGELVNPNSLLVIEFAKIKKNPYAATIDKVLSWNVRISTSQNGNNVIRVTYVTECRTFDVYYMLKMRHEWVPFSMATLGFIVETEQDYIDAHFNGKTTKPENIKAYRENKGSRFYKVDGYNYG